MQAFYSGMTVVGSLVITALIIVLTYFFGRWYARRMKGAVRGRHIKVVDRVDIGSGCVLVVVMAADKFYLLGVSDKNMRLICELDTFSPELYRDIEPQNSFGQVFDVFLKKIGGKDTPDDNGGG